MAPSDKVAALDQLEELCRAEGLRRAAHKLGITPGWLSSQLAIRRDPTVFGALKLGKISFGQAAELVRAPVPAREDLLQRILADPGHVSTSALRSWVAEVRAQSGSQATERTSPYQAVATQVSGLEVPRSPTEVAALEYIFSHAGRLLAAARDKPVARRSRKVASTEIVCLMCGAPVGDVEHGRGFHPRSQSAVRFVGRRIACGRCGGSLAPGERNERYIY